MDDVVQILGLLALGFIISKMFGDKDKVIVERRPPSLFPIMEISESDTDGDQIIN